MPENTPNSTDIETSERSAIESGSSSAETSAATNVVHPETFEPTEPIAHLQVQGSYTVGGIVGIMIGLFAAVFAVLLWGVYGECTALDPKINNV